MLENMIVFLSRNILYFMLHLENSSSFPRPFRAGEERDCIRQMEQGNEKEAVEAKNALIEHNLRLVAHIAKKYYAVSSDQEDLVSIGTIGLIKAANTFRSSRNIRFATYASRCIENAIPAERNRQIFPR